MLQKIKNALNIPELRQKILFTVMIVILYRIGAVLPVPYVSADFLEAAMSNTGSLFQFINVLSGGAFS